MTPNRFKRPRKDGQQQVAPGRAEHQVAVLRDPLRGREIREIARFLGFDEFDHPTIDELVRRLQAWQRDTHDLIDACRETMVMPHTAPMDRVLAYRWESNWWALRLNCLAIDEDGKVFCRVNERDQLAFRQRPADLLYAELIVTGVSRYWLDQDRTARQWPSRFSPSPTRDATGKHIQQPGAKSIHLVRTAAELTRELIHNACGVVDYQLAERIEREWAARQPRAS